MNLNAVLLLAAGAWFIYLAISAFRGEPIGVFGWVVGRPFKGRITEWSARLAPFALTVAGTWLIYAGVKAW